MRHKAAPTVSVIIPNFNRGALITETINSIIAQTYHDWEAIIVDDGSTDNSITIVEKFQETDRRIKLIARNRLPKGAPTCRNIGLEHAVGKYLIFLDSDDLIKESCLEDRIALAVANPHLDFLVFHCVLFKNHIEDLNILWNVFTDENDLDRFLKLDVPWQTASVIYKKAIFQKFGNWDETLLSFQDWELAVRLLMNDALYKKFDIYDCYWRVAQNDTIGLKSKTKEHLESHGKLFFNVSKLLGSSTLNNRKRRLLLAGLYYWLIEIWLTNGKRREAYALWLRAFHLKLINRSVLIQGMIYFTFFKHRFLGKRLVRMIKKIWPKELLRKSSNTFRKIPLMKLL